MGTVVGLVVIGIAYSPPGRRSGAHLNPVVTLRLALQRIVGAAIEATATATQLVVVFGCLASARWQRLTPVAAGVLLAGAIAALAPVTGAGFNPVRGLAPDAVAVAYPAVWIYIAGPAIGALAAAGAIVRPGRQPRTGKLVHDPSIPCYVRCELPHITTGPARAGLIKELS